MTSNSPANPLDDPKLEKNPIESMIPRGRSYWLAILALMVVAGFWQYYVLYIYLPSKPIAWKELSSQVIDEAKVVRRPVLLWVVDLPAKQAKTLIKRCNAAGKAAASGQPVHQEAKSAESQNGEGADTNADSNSELGRLVGKINPFQNREFRAEFHNKGCQSFLAFLPKDLPILKSNLEQEVKPGFYFFNSFSEYEVRYFAEGKEAEAAVREALRTANAK